MTLDFNDEVLCENLNHVISGLLPHEKYEPKTFGLLYPTLQQVLKTQNARGLYFIFYSVFDRYASLQASFNSDAFSVNITRERFEKALENNLPDFILEPQLDVERLMNEEGKSGDISIPTIQNEAMGIVFEKTMALYDLCFDLAQSFEDAMAYIIDLKDSIRANVIETGLQMQRTIMSTGLRYNRKTYQGTNGWITFAQQLVREVAELDSDTKDDLECNTLDILPSVETRSVDMSTGLAGYGIPQLDDRTPMLRNRFVVLVAKENTGKTKVVTHLIATLIRAGIKPYFACGEAQPQSMLMHIVSSYLFQENNMFFEPTDLVGDGYEALTAEEKQIVQTAKARVAKSGLIISNSLEYDNVTSTFTEAYRKGCEAFFLDHSQSLRGRKGRKISELVTTLALDCRDFKNNFPVYIMLTSHPSTDLKDILQKGQSKDIQKSPTAQSATPSQEADELFILNDTDYYRKQNILQWITQKRRGAVKPQPFFVRKLFHVDSFLYDPDIQSGDVMDGEEVESMIKLSGAAFLDADLEDDEDAADLQVDY